MTYIKTILTEHKDKILETYDSLIARRNQLTQEIYALNSEITTIAMVIDSYELRVKNPVSTSISNNEYPFKGSFGDKIIYSIKKGNNTAIDITDFIITNEPQDKAKLLNKVGSYCSTMAKPEGSLTAKRDGKKNLYYVKNEEKTAPASTEAV